MMELADAVDLFSTETFADVFNLMDTFSGRIDPFAEITNSGGSAERRILETPTDVTIPTGRVIQDFTGKKFIVGVAHRDYWDGGIIRHKYSILPVAAMGVVGTIGEILAENPQDSSVYMFPYFVRRETDQEEESDYLSGYELYFSNVKSFHRGVIGVLAGRYYRFKTETWEDTAGYGVVQAVQLESPLQVFDISTDDTTTYNPATDSYGLSVTNGVTCFVEPLKQDYDFISPSFVDIEVGDKAISVLKSDATILVGTLIGDYRVVSVRDQGTWVTAQCRYLS